MDKLNEEQEHKKKEHERKEEQERELRDWDSATLVDEGT